MNFYAVLCRRLGKAMRKLLSALLIISHLYTICSHGMLQDEEGLTVHEVAGKYFSIKKGSADGVNTGDYYQIIRTWLGGETVIGTAQVVMLKEHVAALEPIDMKEGFKVMPGDKLNPISSILFEVQRKEEFKKEDVGKEINYAIKGRRMAESEYSGGGALAGGLIAGLLLGILGWLIGWAVVASSEISVPTEHVVGLSDEDRYQFTDSYKKAVKTRKLGKYHTGAAIGMLAWVMIYFAIVAE